MKKIARLDEEFKALSIEIWKKWNIASPQIKRFQHELNDILDFIETDERALYAARYKESLKKYLMERITFNKLKLKPRENAEMIILAEQRIMAAYMEKEHLLNDFAGLTMLSDNEKFN